VISPFVIAKIDRNGTAVDRVARVHGAALGGGMGLCAVSDLVIAEAGARFGLTESICRP
jgi:1,4-dihydroxy-2-naphthoyl-CoA synthase